MSRVGKKHQSTLAGGADTHGHLNVGILSVDVGFGEVRKVVEI